MSNSNEPSETEHQKASLLQVVFSVMAAMFGVRSARAHERDFTKGRPAAYIIVGLIFTALFVGTLAGIVLLVLNLSGA